MSVVGILYGGYSFRYQSDFARKTFLCTRRVPQNQVSHSYQYLLATEEQPCFSIGYMNIILQKAQKSIVCCLSGAVPFGSAPLFLFQGGNNHVRVSIRIKTNRGLPTLPDLPAIYTSTDGRPEHSRKRRLRPFLFYGTLQLRKLPHLISPHRRHQLYRLPWRMGLHPQGAVPMAVSYTHLTLPTIYSV